MLTPIQKTVANANQYGLTDIDLTPTSDTVGMIIGLVITIIFLIIFFVFLAYFLPWWNCYNFCCFFGVENLCCNYLKCFFYCPCREKKAYEKNQKNSNDNNKMFVQDLLAGPDGSIIHLSDIRSVNGPRAFDVSCNANMESSLI